MPNSKVRRPVKKTSPARQLATKRRLGPMAETGTVLGELPEAGVWCLETCRGNGKPVREIAISKFKATCLAELENVRRTRTSIRITRFGKPIADILPPPVAAQKSWLGCMEDTMKITGDIVGPVGAFDGWDPD